MTANHNARRFNAGQKWSVGLLRSQQLSVPNSFAANITKPTEYPLYSNETTIQGKHIINLEHHILKTRIILFSVQEPFWLERWFL
jgi:hypothetical protein